MIKRFFLLGGFPSDLENSLACSNGSGLRKLWKNSLPNIAVFMLRLTSPHCAVLREDGVIPLVRISRTCRRPRE